MRIPISLYRYSLLSATYLLMGTMLSLEAQTEQERSQHNLGAVIVTGTQTQRSLKSLPMIAQVITQKDIERVHPRNMTDVLQMTIPGVQISVHGAQYRVSIQGMQGDYILFLVDGERITSEGNGVVDLSRIDMASIERIEVVRGAASALYGSNAIGGVVNFITKQATKPLQVNALADWSGEGVRRYNLSVGLKRAGFSSLTQGGWTEQKAYDLPNGNNRATILGSKTLNLGEQLRYRSADNRLDTKAYLRYSLRKQVLDRKVEYHYKTFNAGGRLFYAPKPQHSLSLQYNIEGYDRETYYPLVKIASERYEPIFDFTGHTLRGQYNYGVEHQDKILLNVGAEHITESLRGDRFENFKEVKKAQTTSVYAQADWRLLPRLSLVGGLRADFHSRFGGHLSPRLSLLYKLGADWRLRAAYTEGFRSPSIKELFMNWDHLGMFFIQGNTDIKPELSRMLSFSPEWQYKNLNITLIASYNWIGNRITMREENNGALYRYHNSSGIAQLLNLQTNIRYKLPYGLGLQLDYAYLYDGERVTTTDGKTVGISSLRPHNLNGSLSYDRSWHRWSFSASYAVRYASGVDVATESDAVAGGYTVRHYAPYSISRIGLSAGWNSRVRLTLGVDNLFDYRPEQINISSSLSPGINLFGSLTLTY